MHRETLPCRYRVTDAPEDIYMPTKMDTQRHAKIHIHPYDKHIHTNTYTDTHSPPRPIFLAQLHMEKLLEKKNNVRAYGGGEGGRKPECQPGRQPRQPHQSCAGNGGRGVVRRGCSGPGPCLLGPSCSP